MSRKTGRIVDDLTRRLERIQLPELPPDLPRVSILEAMERRDLFGPAFEGDSWGAWKAFIAAAFALPMDEEALKLARECTGRLTLPASPVSESWAICGRRAGKGRIAALLGVYLACFRLYSGILAPGEMGVVPVIAADRTQARVVFRYIRALLEMVPALKRMIQRETLEVIELSNGVAIEVKTASFRSARGYTCVGAVIDEVAFLRDEDSALPDVELLNALRPAMATVPEAVLLGISSPYARRGVLWQAFDRHYGRDESIVLVWKAPTWVMNPAVPQSVIDDAYEADPVAAAAEYGAEFRSDVGAFLSREALDAAVVRGRFELPPVAGIQHVAFVDPSGGASDSMTLAIAHREGEVAVLDAVRERTAPFSPKEVVAEFAALLKTYGITKVRGDRYAGEWPREAFGDLGITYEPSERSKSEIYRELLPGVNSGRVELLDHPKLRVQLEGLERRTARGGRDSIDHPPGRHDDLANAAAGAVVEILGVASIARIISEWETLSTW